MKGEKLMSNDVSLSTFPSGKVPALAILYLQNQDLSKATPEDIVDKYLDAYERINNRFKEAGKERRESFYK
jgi:hypothetical protein